MTDQNSIAPKGWFEILKAGAIVGFIIDVVGSPFGQFIVFVWISVPAILIVAFVVARARGSRFGPFNVSSQDFGWILASTVAFEVLLWPPIAAISFWIFSIW